MRAINRRILQNVIHFFPLVTLSEIFRSFILASASKNPTGTLGARGVQSGGQFKRIEISTRIVQKVVLIFHQVHKIEIFTLFHKNVNLTKSNFYFGS